MRKAQGFDRVCCSSCQTKMMQTAGELIGIFTFRSKIWKALMIWL